ncbi:MAG: M48 family metallopeptidase [Gammaproteobacteria bacterium]
MGIPLSIFAHLLSATTTYAAEPIFCQGEIERAKLAVSRIREEWPLRGPDDLTQYIQRLGTTVAHSDPRGRRMQWHFGIVRDYAPNAFSAGNGYIYVTDGTVRFAQTEAELAGVLAHEIGHELAGHFCLDPRAGERSFWDLVGRNNKQGDRTTQRESIGSLTQVIDTEKELEADRLAVTLLEFAGYDARGMLAMSRRLPPGAGPAASHLQNQRRITALERLLAGVPSRSARDSLEFQQLKQKLATE